MTTKFYGSLRGLKSRVLKCGVRGKWRYVDASDLHQFKAETGENLNWWPRTGTLTFQGGEVPALQDRYARLFLPRETRRSTGAHGKGRGRPEAALGRGRPRRSLDNPPRALLRPKPRRF